MARWLLTYNSFPIPDSGRGMFRELVTVQLFHMIHFPK